MLISLKKTGESMTPFIKFSMKVMPKTIVGFSSGGKDISSSLFLNGGEGPYNQYKSY